MVKVAAMAMAKVVAVAMVKVVAMAMVKMAAVPRRSGPHCFRSQGRSAACAW